jgi:hypothetical protein
MIMKRKEFKTENKAPNSVGENKPFHTRKLLFKNIIRSPE